MNVYLCRAAGAPVRGWRAGVAHEAWRFLPRGSCDRIGRTARGYGRARSVRTGRDDRCGGELLGLQEAFVLLDCSLLSPFYQSKTKIHDILTSRELRPAPQLASRHPSRIQTRLHSEWRSGSFHDGEGEENSRRLKGMRRRQVSFKNIRPF